MDLYLRSHKPSGKLITLPDTSPAREFTPENSNGWKRGFCLFSGALAVSFRGYKEWILPPQKKNKNKMEV